MRQRFPDVLLQVDANSAYTMANWRRLQALDDLDLLLIEQPLFDDDIVLHSEISRELRTPICLDESIHSCATHRPPRALGAERRARPPDRQHQAAASLRVCGSDRHRPLLSGKGIRTWIGGMLDSAWGKAMNLNFNGLPRSSCREITSRPAGPISSRTSPKGRSSPRQVNSRLTTASQPASLSTGRASSGWVRVVYQEAFDLHNRGSRSI